MEKEGLLYNKEHKCLEYADHAIKTRSIKELQAVVVRLDETAQKTGIQINKMKTKYTGKYSFYKGFVLVAKKKKQGTIFRHVACLKNTNQELY